MKDILKQVEEFHRAFEQPVANKPGLISQERYSLRVNLLTEETMEYLEACQKEDLTEVADALGDQLYILAGTMIEHGMQDKIVEVFQEIHRSNMSKLDSVGNPIYREDGKVVKGENYFPPNLVPIIES